MKNVSDKRCKDNQNTHLCSVTFFFRKSCLCGKMWKNSVERGRSQMTIWRIRISCRTPKTTNLHSEYVILITLPLQQWLHERVSMFHYTYTACLIYLAKEKLSKIYIGSSRIKQWIDIFINCNWVDTRRQ